MTVEPLLRKLYMAVEDPKLFTGLVLEAALNFPNHTRTLLAINTTGRRYLQEVPKLNDWRIAVSPKMG